MTDDEIKRLAWAARHESMGAGPNTVAALCDEITRLRYQVERARELQQGAEDAHARVLGNNLSVEAERDACRSEAHRIALECQGARATLRWLKAILERNPDVCGPDAGFIFQTIDAVLNDESKP